jgi:GlpG protein
MRLIGTIPTDPDAERFSAYLVTLKINSSIDESPKGDFEVWIEDDDHVDRGKSELYAFLQNPADPKYDAAVREAKTIRKQKEKSREKRQRNFIDFRTRWGQPQQWAAPVTLALIIVSCVISVGSGSIRFASAQPRAEVINVLTFTSVQRGAYEKWQLEHFVPTAAQKYDFSESREEADPGRRRARVGVIMEARAGYWLDHLKRGQVWRIFTPIFVHWSIIHLLFNMFWTRDLGGMIEIQRGTRVLLPLVITCAAVPNIAQYFHHGPSAFGGMSGVVYGLFGYVWVKGRYQPHLGLGVSEQTSIIMIAWLFICMTGIIGPVANTAHVVGLLTGAAIAYGPIGVKKLRKSAEAT